MRFTFSLCHNRFQKIHAFFTLSILTFLAQGSSLEVKPIFGPEINTGEYKHPSSLTELHNGDLFLAYYGGAGEYATATSVFGARLAKDAEDWTHPIALASNPFQSMGNPVVWQGPDEMVWLFYVVRPGKTWSSSRIMAKVSSDGAKSWSDAFTVSWEAGTMVRSRPIVLANGNYLLPIYHELGDDTELTSPETTSLFLHFDIQTRLWEESTRIKSRLGNLQPAVVSLSDNHLLTFCRRGGDYEPGNDGYVVRSESFDGGKTWSPGKETEFPNPNAAVELIKLRSQNILFIYNHSFNDRTPLRAAISLDQGKTFPFAINLMEGDGSYSYPTAIQTKDGKIHVTFTSDGRTTIQHAIFEEADVLNQ